MINFGTAPASNEVEIILFGPGYGEAIAVHLGDQNWLLIDSCINPINGEPASSSYLDSIGVPPDKVRAIVASHWHDDHVRGISKVAAKYPLADFIVSSIFNEKEAAYFLAAYSGSSAPGQACGSKELFEVMKQKADIYFVHHRSIVVDITLSNNQKVQVTAFSPLHAAISQSIAHMAHYLPKPSGGSPINHAPDLKPNLESVALHIDLGDDAVILGSDLEENKQLGWSAVIADKWSGSRKAASAYKIAHHGSESGDTPDIWSKLLEPSPTAILTPFNSGRHKLPTEIDKQRIRSNTPHGYTSSIATRRPALKSTQINQLRNICKSLSQINAGFGAIRLRKSWGTSSWNVECFGDAQKL